ncbi:MAG: helix-turn-helix domain-containing protein, partial [Gammaproteobacteria bacterium]
MPLIEPTVMSASNKGPVEVLMVAVPETAGSALYGMVDVLLATGNIWQTLVRAESQQSLFRVRIVAPDGAPFTCGNRIPVVPDFPVADNPGADILILPELWLGPDEDIHGRYPELMEWIRRSYQAGATLYSACSGAVMLAETGLLDGCEATSHWGYQDLFRRRYPKIRFRPEPNLVFADPVGRIVTAGGTTSWHDLALHIISRHCSPGEALRIAKVYLLKWHGEGQLPYAVLVRRTPHADAVVRACEQWLGQHFLDAHAIKRVVEQAKIPERTLKRRFRAATGDTLIDYLQNLRVEEAKRLLESGDLPVEEISIRVSYEDPSFFRRLFKRRTG